MSVSLRPMRQDEYEVATAAREAEVVASLAGTTTPEEALRRARQDTTAFLPDGLATAGHLLLVAEADGLVVGHAWLGLSDPRTGSAETAWLYDVEVRAEHRGAGHGRALLSALEDDAREAGSARLALNVFGSNGVALGLYASSGYEVTTQQMAKALR